MPQVAYSSYLDQASTSKSLTFASA
ncbi:unnamed protein product [Oikopleura dioica]|uniref:Uncharacterized protein n=1 Tax=Oikopleura dioica TaxID=34765 RepID=E4Z1E2_OIKDI|nr:unnamed protein product [Oikopleura dioica]